VKIFVKLEPVWPGDNYVKTVKQQSSILFYKILVNFSISHLASYVQSNFLGLQKVAFGGSGRIKEGYGRLVR